MGNNENVVYKSKHHITLLDWKTSFWINVVMKKNF